MITGTPASCTNCFGRSPPSRVPLPAATTMATFILSFCVGDARQRRRRLYFPQGAACSLAVSCPFGVFRQTSEDHLTCGGLQYAGDCNVSVLTNQPSRVVHH